MQRWLNSTSWWFLTAREVSKTSGGLGAQGQCRRREADVELHHLSQPLLVLLVFLFLPPQMVCVVVMFKHIWFAQQNYKVLNCAKWRILPLGTITCLTIFIVKCMLLAYSAPCDLVETGGTACVRQNEKVGVCMIRDMHRHFWEGMNINRCQFWVGVHASLSKRFTFFKNSLTASPMVKTKIYLIALTLELSCCLTTTLSFCKGFWNFWGWLWVEEMLLEMNWCEIADAPSLNLRYVFFASSPYL